MVMFVGTEAQLVGAARKGGMLPLPSSAVASGGFATPSTAAPSPGDGRGSLVDRPGPLQVPPWQTCPSPPPVTAAQLAEFGGQQLPEASPMEKMVEVATAQLPEDEASLPEEEDEEEEEEEKDLAGCDPFAGMSAAELAAELAAHHARAAHIKAARAQLGITAPT